MHRLKHLRDFTLGVELCHKSGHCNAEEFHMRLDERRGLFLVDVKLTGHHGEVAEDVLGWQVAATELKRTSKGGKGDGIIDFFLEPEFWTSWCFTYPEVSKQR